MGQSTDAILFFGYCWDYERAAPWLGEDEAVADGDEDWEERYARAKGVRKPAERFPQPHDTSPEAERVRALYRAHWERKGDLAKASGCEVGSHCSGDCPMPFVAVTASKTVARRGYPEAVSSLAVGEGWQEQLTAFCRALGVTPPPEQQPGWWLVSDWN